jgi:hypothetical protein
MDTGHGRSTMNVALWVIQGCSRPLSVCSQRRRQAVAYLLPNTSSNRSIIAFHERLSATSL